MTETVGVRQAHSLRWKRARGERVAPGLAVAEWELGNYWMVTHTRSGLALARACCENEARRIAELAAPVIDWRASARTLRGLWPDPLRRKLERAGIDMRARNYCSVCG